MQGLLKNACDMAVASTNKLMSGSIQRSTRYAQALQSGLVFFQNIGTPGIADLVHKMHEWMVNNQQSTTMMDLLDLAEVSEKAGGVAELDSVQKLMDLLVKAKIDADRTDLQCAAISLLVSTFHSFLVEACRATHQTSHH